MKQPRLSANARVPRVAVGGNAMSRSAIVDRLPLQRRSCRHLLRGLAPLSLTAVLAARAGHASAAALPAAASDDGVAIAMDDRSMTMTTPPVSERSDGTGFRFVVTNNGHLFHRFAVRDGKRQALGTIPVETRELACTFAEPGRHFLTDGIGGDDPGFDVLRTSMALDVSA